MALLKHRYDACRDQSEIKEQLERFIPQDVRPKIEMIYMGVKEPKVDQKRVEEFREKYEYHHPLYQDVTCTVIFVQHSKIMEF